jgi:outer membrane receptor for monomeric catechols
VRALGFAPKRVAVDLVGRRPAVVDVVLDDRVAALERVVIKGEARRTLRQRRADEFMQRAARIGAARLVTAADIERRGAVQVSDALRMIPGLRVVPGTNTASRNVIRGRMNCVPEVYVDGMIMYAGADDLDLLLSPGDVLGVEVYLGFGGVPAQYGRTGNDCGTVLVWTK